MKKFTFLAFTAFLFLTTTKTFAQEKPKAQPLERCGTMQALAQWQAENPAAVQQNRLTIERLLNNPQRTGQANRTQAIVTIPVVFHVVLPNPFQVTDADLIAQVNRLNLDYSGLNPDSLNAGAFLPLRGHSEIRFVLAKRTPGGQLTNGIERRASSTIYTAGANDPIKSAAAGGLDVWDATQYFNVWVGTGGGLLGYATFPGTSTPSQQGVVTDIIGTAANPCYVDPSYNLGRTLTHEAGHYFGLYHTFGTDNGCVNSDFGNLPGTCIISDPTLAGTDTDQTIGDTPNQGDPNFGCPTGILPSNCGQATGDMYQNYMDYTNDPCMTMFTLKQAARMEWVVNNCRTGYLTTVGGTAPAGATLLDAAPQASVNPGGFELIGCNTVTYPATLSCPGSLAPKFRVVNNGLTTITSLTVGYRYDNGTAVTQSITVTIPSGGTYVHTFSSSVSASIGTHSFKFFTANPNGGTDQVPANDTLTQALTVAAPAATPFAEGFESATFPPTNWSVVNPNGDFTWVRTTPGRNASAGKASIDNWTLDRTGNIDDLRTPSITVNPANQYVLTYDIAHRPYPNSFDVLSILVSTNCGQTFTQIYSASGATLGTATATTANYTTPAAADWATRSIAIPASLLASGQIQIAFRNTTDFGNWIHLDNINIAQLTGRDLRLSNIVVPGTTQCSPTFTPSVTVTNDGTEAVTSFKVGYRVDQTGTNVITTFTQTIAPGATATVSLPVTTVASGTHTFIAFTADPVSVSGTGDTKLSNDTATKVFTIVPLIQLPVIEGFETSFPPAGWTIVNPNANVTWIRKTPGRNSTYSAFIDNFNNLTTGQIDDIRIPFMNIAGADSVIITFDLAHKNYPGSNDLLQVGATFDCGTTYTAVYGKAGATLATAGPSNADYQVPAATDWRTERIALGGAVLAPGSLGLLIRNTNDFGNNIFIDNINISGLFKRDLQLVSINSPGTLVCSTAVTPTVTVRNIGSETVTAFKISYSINGAAPVTQTVSSISLVRNAQLNVTLAAATVNGAGAYTLRVYSWDPVTVSGTGDQNTRNDTLTRLFSVPGSVNAPLTESFVSTTFPPANWSVLNPDGGITWSRNNAGNGNAGSAYVNTFNYTATGQRDDLITPSISFGTVDSVRLSFDLAASTYSYPGSTAVPIDTLEVLVTRDCGNTFTSVYKKWGNELQTISDPNAPQTSEFTPSAANQWRRENVNLSSFAAQSPLLVAFRVTSNFENNIFIDNVNFSTQTLPAQLKQQGYLVYPTAVRNSVNIWHFQTPTTLRYINVVNSIGQTVYSRQYTGNADRQMAIDLNGKAAGVYFVQLGYTDANRNVTQRIVKY